MSSAVSTPSVVSDNTIGGVNAVIRKNTSVVTTQNNISGTNYTYTTTSYSYNKAMPKIAGSTVNISLDVKSGSITYLLGNNKSVYNLSSYLYDPSKDYSIDVLKGYNVSTQYELAKLTNKWYTATNEQDRDAIESMLRLIQVYYKEDGFTNTVKDFLEKGLRNAGIDITSYATWLAEGSSLDNEVGMLEENRARYLVGSVTRLTANAMDMGNKVHYDQLNGGKGEWLPTELQNMYKDTEFKFARRGQSGADIEVTGGKHPSQYKVNPLKWPSGFDYGDFKPYTGSGYKTFLKDINSGKLPSDSVFVPYNSKSGKMVIPKIMYMY